MEVWREVIVDARRWDGLSTYLLQERKIEEEFVIKHRHWF
jgi:hypothetical protein